MYWRILRILAAVPRWMLPTPLNLKIDSLLAEESDTLIRDLAARVVSYDPTTTPRQHFATEVDIAIEQGASLEEIEQMAPASARAITTAMHRHGKWTDIDPLTATTIYRRILRERRETGGGNDASERAAP